jgi:myo-inosose-2 dehydratase
MTVTLGTNPIAWSNDDLPELGGETPLDTCLFEAREAGFTGIELGNKFPRQADKLRPILEAHRLSLISGWYSANLIDRSVDQEIEAMEPHLALLAALGCKVMVFCDTFGAVHGDRGTPLSQRSVLPEDAWPEFGRKLTAVGDHMAKRGVRLAYHHHMGTLVQSEAEVDLLMQHTGLSVGLLLDSGHMTVAGGDPAALAKRYASRINHVHAKDVRRDVLEKVRDEDWSFLDGVIGGLFTVPGDGMIDFPRIFDALPKSYAGWMVVEAEQDPAKAHPLTYARLGYRNLWKFATGAGFEVKS